MKPCERSRIREVSIFLAGERSPEPAKEAQNGSLCNTPAPHVVIHTGNMGRIIGTILGAILAIWLVVTAASGIFATFKTFLIVALIAVAVFVVVWLMAGRPRRG